MYQRDREIVADTMIALSWTRIRADMPPFD
jgi:hypothetical protein